MRITRIQTLGVLSLAGAVFVSQALAIPLPLPPGGSAPLTPVAVPVGGLLATITDDFSNLLYSGEVQSWVYADPAWPAGLTFVYQVRLDADADGSASVIHQLSTYTWNPFATFVEQDPAAGFPGFDANRDPLPGGAIGFNFPALGFDEGLDSALLIVRTDAPAWTGGIGGVINGQTSNVDILTPAPIGVPDGGTTAVLLGLVFLGIDGLRRFRVV